MNLETVTKLHPMSFRRSLLFFGLPLLMMMLCFRVLIPLMDLMGVRLFVTFLVALGGPFLLLLLLSLRFYRKEGNTWNIREFRERFRLNRMQLADWIWTLFLTGFVLVTNILMSSTYDWIANWIAVPKFLVRMHDQDPNYFMELPVHGNFWIPLGMLAFALINVLGEEFWWRGYILPRQELSLGKWTWLIHGALWSVFHLFMPWEAIRFLPVALALPFVAQRRKNTWPGIIAHFAIYVPGLIIIMKSF